jgi:CubicO group peptidase (beta-lactamase class C family)
MILVEECKLRLDEPVERLLPELAGRKVLKRLDGPLEETVPAIRSISVRDVLTFRLGFGAVMEPPGTYPIQREAVRRGIRMVALRPQEQPDPDEWIRAFGTLPLMHQPGEKWMYDTGSDLLGVLISRASGQSFSEFLRQRIFEPLGMKDTGFSVRPELHDRFATSYWTDPESGAFKIYDDAANGQWSRPPAFPSGGAGLVSTTDDYFSFAQMMLNKGKHRSTRILSSRSVELMTTDHLTPEQKAVSGLVPDYFAANGWGFGLSVLTKRNGIAGAVGRFGWDGGLGTSWYSDPKEDLTGILMTQSAWTSPSPPNVCLDFWTSAYRAIDE